MWSVTTRTIEVREWEVWSIVYIDDILRTSKHRLLVVVDDCETPLADFATRRDTHNGVLIVADGGANCVDGHVVFSMVVVSGGLMLINIWIGKTCQVLVWCDTLPQLQSDHYLTLSYFMIVAQSEIVLDIPMFHDILSGP